MFLRNGIYNINSKIYIDYSQFRPSFNEIANLIHDAKGFAFLAHPFQYKFKDTIKFIDELNIEKKLDGIECYYSEFTDEQSNILYKYAKNNGLYMCGGSDYHGNLKSDINIGTGKGNLNISKSIVEEWIGKI